MSSRCFDLLFTWVLNVAYCTEDHRHHYDQVVRPVQVERPEGVLLPFTLHRPHKLHLLLLAHTLQLQPPNDVTCILLHINLYCFHVAVLVVIRLDPFGSSVADTHVDLGSSFNWESDRWTARRKGVDMFRQSEMRLDLVCKFSYLLFRGILQCDCYFWGPTLPTFSTHNTTNPLIPTLSDQRGSCCKISVVDGAGRVKMVIDGSPWTQVRNFFKSFFSIP